MTSDLIRHFCRGKVLNIQQSHMQQHPEMAGFMQEVFERFLKIEKNYSGDIIKVAIDMGRIIGKTNCVRTTENDTVFYAKRIGRKTLSRFIHDVEPKNCNTITVVIHRKKNQPSRFYLLTAYIGEIAEKEPLDSTIRSEQEFSIATSFWNQHALIASQSQIDETTITQECPWITYQPYVKKTDCIVDRIHSLRLEEKPLLKNNLNQ